ncbi:MAG TPA: aminotransferase class IV, partial [Gammaproteobacteria bacterium]
MILVDGRRVDRVPADDRGLAYGDGLFETLRARRGRLPLLDYHLERLFAGLEVLGFPPLRRDLLHDELLEAAGECPEGVVKLIVTRGSGARGYLAPANCEPRRIVSTANRRPDISGWREQGVVLRICRTP